jgi:hypothetical protein
MKKKKKEKKKRERYSLGDSANIDMGNLNCDIISSKI